ncbi:NrsF family protein [Oleomonas cavernae]|uniref:NrsF family protein n=1 Tax=Oleomonas cavernae TaxID=2320859 RepID=UPI0013149054|nr:NrsF family protein [Oleomonas cavernae]
MTVETDRLIEELTRQAKPVRRLSPPLRRACLWLLGAVVVIAATAAFHGLNEAHGFHHMWAKLVETKLALQILASLASGVTAIVAAFMISLPDRSPNWSLLPLPALALWALSIGYGCLTDWIERGPDGFKLGTSFGCFLTIVGTSVPLGLLLGWALRYATAFRPLETMTMGALGVAALSATGLSFYHELDATIMILLWHGGSTLIVILMTRLIGARLLQRTARPVRGQA